MLNVCLLVNCIKDDVVLKMRHGRKTKNLRTYKTNAKGKLLDLEIKETAAIIKMITYFMAYAIEY